MTSSMTSPMVCAAPTCIQPREYPLPPPCVLHTLFSARLSYNVCSTQGGERILPGLYTCRCVRHLHVYSPGSILSPPPPPCVLHTLYERRAENNVQRSITVFRSRRGEKYQLFIHHLTSLFMLICLKKGQLLPSVILNLSKALMPLSSLSYACVLNSFIKYQTLDIDFLVI